MEIRREKLSSPRLLYSNVNKYNNPKCSSVYLLRRLLLCTVAQVSTHTASSMLVCPALISNVKSCPASLPEDYQQISPPGRRPSRPGEHLQDHLVAWYIIHGHRPHFITRTPLSIPDSVTDNKRTFEANLIPSTRWASKPSHSLRAKRCP